MLGSQKIFLHASYVNFRSSQLPLIGASCSNIPILPFPSSVFLSVLPSDLFAFPCSLATYSPCRVPSCSCSPLCSFSPPSDLYSRVLPLACSPLLGDSCSPLLAPLSLLYSQLPVPSLLSTSFPPGFLPPLSFPVVSYRHRASSPP